MRKKTLTPNIVCHVNNKDELVRIGVLFIVLLTLDVFTKTNHFTVNAKNKYGKHDVKIYSFVT